MKFYQSGLESVVWNPEKGIPLAEFMKPDFTFTTNNPETIKTLQGLGYQELPESAPAGDGDDKPQVTARLKG